MFVARHQTLQLDIITDATLRQSATQGFSGGKPSGVQVVH